MDEKTLAFIIATIVKAYYMPLEAEQQDFPKMRGEHAQKTKTSYIAWRTPLMQQYQKKNYFSLMPRTN
jgi:hypothetical protein